MKREISSVGKPVPSVGALLTALRPPNRQLLYAAMKGKLGTVMKILNDENSCHPLDYKTLNKALLRIHFDLECTQALIKNGAQVNVLYGTGETLLMKVLDNQLDEPWYSEEDIALYLIENGADVKFRCEPPTPYGARTAMGSRTASSRFRYFEHMAR